MCPNQFVSNSSTVQLRFVTDGYYAEGVFQLRIEGEHFVYFYGFASNFVFPIYRKLYFIYSENFQNVVWQI